MDYDIEQYVGSTLRPRRDIRNLTVGQLTQLSRDTAHRRRAAVVIGGVEVQENLRQRLTRERDEITEAMTAMAGILSRRNEQLALLDKFPQTDPFKDGQVIEFEKTFPHSDKSYSYAALRSEGLWYVTGDRSPNAVTWAELIEWFGVGVREVYTKRSGTTRTKAIG